MVSFKPWLCFLKRSPKSLTLGFKLSSCLGPCKPDSFQMKLKQKICSRRASEDTQPLKDVCSTDQSKVSTQDTYNTDSRSSTQSVLPYQCVPLGLHCLLLQKHVAKIMTEITLSIFDLRVRIRVTVTFPSHTLKIYSWWVAVTNQPYAFESVFMLIYA